MTRQRNNHVNCLLTAYDFGYKRDDYTPKLTVTPRRINGIPIWPSSTKRIDIIGHNGFIVTNGILV
jgi:hypothetical protein